MSEELKERLTLLKKELVKVTDNEILRLEQERDFLKSVRDKSLGGLKKDEADNTDSVVSDVGALLGLE